MPQRLFVSQTWSIDAWFQQLSRDQRYLFIYLWTNDHVNQAGVYHIPTPTMAFETKFTEDEIRDILPSLSPKVRWFPNENIIWVRNFIKYQAKSPKFLVAAANCLKTIRNNGLVKEVLEYNRGELGVLIPYQYSNGEVSIPPVPDTVPDAVPGGKKIGSGEEETSPPSESEIEESLSAGDREVISVWCSVKGLKMSLSDTSELVARLRTEFPGVDILSESKKWAARKLSDPLTRKARPSSQIWNWMSKAREFALERRKGEHNTQRSEGTSVSSGTKRFSGGKW